MCSLYPRFIYLTILAKIKGSNKKMRGHSAMDGVNVLALAGLFSVPEKNFIGQFTIVCVHYCLDWLRITV